MGSMIIGEMPRFTYGIIIVSSILIGCFAAACLMKYSGARKETIFYTVVINIVMILAFSLMLSVLLTGSILKMGFVAVGGAAGLLFGITFSAILHKDHSRECFSAWIISAPLMYGLSKIACHLTGCCKGIEYKGLINVRYKKLTGGPFFPAQITETVVFILIFLIGLILYLRMKDKLKAAVVVMVISAAAKFGLDYLRYTHVGVIISDNQIMIICLSVITIIVVHFLNKSNIFERSNS
ncbi:MAG: prolipoprotein diacylglyceryl transferase [Lachnospiraceae bacterium]|nr:prolipoprotein diacylglyceryl transferase [Lachnospiraceae bacterium]